MKRIVFILICFFVLSASIGLANGSEKGIVDAQIINSSDGLNTLGSAVWFLPTTNCDLECAENRLGEFTLSEGENISRGLDNREHWFYTKLLDVTDDQEAFYLVTTYPLLDTLEAYLVQDGHVTHLAELGDMYPFKSRVVDHRHFVIPLPLKKHLPAELYLRVRTASSLQLNLSIQNKDDFMGNSIPMELLFGIYFGLILIMSLYNFFIFLSLREITYVFYSIATLSAGMVYAILNGYAFQYLWPESIHFNQVSISYVMAATGIFSILFSLSFLRLGQYSKALQRIAWGMIGICLTISLATLILGYGYYSIYIGVLTITLAGCAVLMLISGIYCWYRGNTSARLFVAAWGFYLMGTLLLIIRNLGFIESGPITSSSAMIGQALEVVLLSFALADRYRNIRKEKERAQNEKLELQQNYARELEQQVQDRTENLNQANTKLNRSLDDLQEKNEIITEKNREIEDSIRYAERIQSAILPSKSAWKKALPNSFVLYKPKDIVAGDFYWLDTVESASGPLTLFAAADCTGHGVPGAMVSVICNNALNRAVKEMGLTQPSAILDQVLSLVVDQFKASEEDVKDGMDIALCAMGPEKNDAQTGKHYRDLQYAGANNPLWVVSTENATTGAQFDAPSVEKDENGLALFELKPTKQPVGKYENPKSYQHHMLRLWEGDVLYVFTDGYADQFGGPHGKKFKYRPMKKLLMSHSAMPMNEQRVKIDASFEAWRGELEQVDDVCLIGVRI